MSLHVTEMKIQNVPEFQRTDKQEVLVIVVQLLSRVRLSATPWTAARQVSLALTVSQSLPKFMTIELVMLSNHLILCHPLLSVSVFPSIRVFSNEPTLRIRWPKYCSSTVSTAGAIRLSFLISCVKVLQPGVIICLSLTPLLLVGSTLPGCNILF